MSLPPSFPITAQRTRFIRGKIKIITIIGCTQTDKINEKQMGKKLKDILPTPDKILIYSNGGTKELDKIALNIRRSYNLLKKDFMISCLWLKILSMIQL